MILPELKYLGQCGESYDYAQYEYKGLNICLHLTVMGATGLRLCWHKDDPVRYRVFCDWCLGNETLLSDTYMVMGFAIMLYCIDNHFTGELPHSSDPRPIWKDAAFMDWFKNTLTKTPFSLIHAVRDRIFEDVDRPGFAKLILKNQKDK